MDAPVNPAIMPGLMFVADSTAATNGAVIRVSFPAKTILTVLYNYSGTSVAVTRQIANGIATIAFTVTGDGTLDFIIIGTATETITTAGLYVSGSSSGGATIGGSQIDSNPVG